MVIGEANVLFDKIINFTLLVRQSTTENKNSFEIRKNFCSILRRTIGAFQIEGKWQKSLNWGLWKLRRRVSVLKIKGKTMYRLGVI